MHCLPHPRHRLFPLAVLLALFAAAGFSSVAGATPMARWQLAEQPVDGGEYLVYRLSYRGIFTAFAWKELADLALIADQQPVDFERQPGCRLQLKLSTENHALAEALRPTRYLRRSLVDRDLRRALLVEEMEDSTEDEQNATWINWADGRIELFRLRRQVRDDSAGFFFDDDDPYPAEAEWEKDGARPLPAFLDTSPLIDGKYTPLIHDKSIDIPELEVLLDPLSLIFAARRHGDETGQAPVFPVTFKDEIRYYRIHGLGRESVEIGGVSWPARKLQIRRTRMEGGGDKELLVMWLSDDERRIPLRFEIRTKIGKIRIHIREQSLRGNHDARRCLAASPPRLAAKDAAGPPVEKQREPRP